MQTSNISQLSNSKKVLKLPELKKLFNIQGWNKEKNIVLQNMVINMFKVSTINE